MKNRQAVYLIFRFENAEEALNLNACYKVCYFFTTHGEVSYEEIKKVLPDFNEEDEIEFHSKDELTEFSYRFIEEHQYPSIYLLNTTDYNIGVESSNDISSYKQIFDKYGLKIDLQKDSQKGILGKFF